MILLDTHVLFWLDQDMPRFGGSCRRALDEALANDGLAVSAISFWEIAMLVEKRRLALDVPLDSWRQNLLAAGLREFPLDGSIGIRAATLEDLHRDPADRMIAATTLVHQCALATADERLLRWEADVEKLHAAR